MMCKKQKAVDTEAADQNSMSSKGALETPHELTGSLPALTCNNALTSI